LHGLALNFVITHQTENPLGFSEVSENQQLLIAIVVSRCVSCVASGYNINKIGAT